MTPPHTGVLEDELKGLGRLLQAICPISGESLVPSLQVTLASSSLPRHRRRLGRGLSCAKLRDSRGAWYSAGGSCRCGRPSNGGSEWGLCRVDTVGWDPRVAAGKVNSAHGRPLAAPGGRTGCRVSGSSGLLLGPRMET